jgi:hypothetical protein
MAVIYSISIMEEGRREVSAGQSSLSSMDTSPVMPLTLGFLKFFQEYLSPTDGPRCALYPTCSEYSQHAVRKYGLLRGTVMTFDRILHEPDERRLKPAELIKGAYRVRDPLSENELSH